MLEVFCLRKNLPSTERFKNLAGLETSWYEVFGLCVALSSVQARYPFICWLKTLIVSFLLTAPSLFFSFFFSYLTPLDLKSINSNTYKRKVSLKNIRDSNFLYPQQRCMPAFNTLVSNSLFFEGNRGYIRKSHSKNVCRSFT